MCDLFQANPWKPLLCTNCHQNRAGHQLVDGGCEHRSPGKTVELPSSSSSMHLYEEIMAQYFTISTTELEPARSTSVIERVPTPSENEIDDEDSFTDEEQEAVRPLTVEFIANQSVINTQGIVLMGPDIRAKPPPPTTKKPKKINLLKKSKSNADECLKKPEINDGSNTSKLWWFKVKKANTCPVNQTDLPTESSKPSATSPALTGPSQQPRIRVLPETNKLTLSEALSMARRQNLLPSREVKPASGIKTDTTAIACNNTQAMYGSSIASTTSSSTQSSADYDTSFLNNSSKDESTYLTAISPVDGDLSLATMLDRTNQLTMQRLSCDLRSILDEYKHNLPVARFQPLKSFLHQHQSSKTLSTESIHFLLLQVLDELAPHSSHSPGIASLDHFLVAHHATVPIVVTTTSTDSHEDESVEQFMRTLSSRLFDAPSLPTFNELSTLENHSCRYLSNQVLQLAVTDADNSISMQRVKLLDLFWSRIPSVRQVHIHDENERFILALYHLMRHLCRSDHSVRTIA